jgi:ketosteroid isomerase-like protein
LSLMEAMTMAAHDPDAPTGWTLWQARPRRHATVARRSRVDAAYRRLSAAVELMDAAALEREFTENAVLIAPDATALEGAASIAAWSEALFRGAREDGMRLGLALDVAERDVQSDVVLDQGTYVLAGRIAATELALRSGRFLAVFRRANGSLDYHLDAASILPLLSTIRDPGPPH